MRLHVALMIPWAIACGDKDGDSGASVSDADGDGWTVADGDCDDDDNQVHPSADDTPYDGVDSDCDGSSDFDSDQDGYDSAYWDGTDCDDDDPEIHPGAEDEEYDGIDSDCDGASETNPDADGDGHDDVDLDGDDCDDTDSSIHPGASETWYDGIDSDCAGDDDFDADADGHRTPDASGDDCDDDDAEVYPGAYDRPDDGVDGDCDGHDRSLDGVVVDAGSSTTTAVSFDFSPGDVDIAVLVDTTCSMGGTLATLDFDSIATDLEDVLDSPQLGFATFDDYGYGSYGYAGTDVPFDMHVQVTDDTALLDDDLAATSIHYGADAPESSIEAIYQALTGDGYDLDCDGSFDSGYDVLPFIAETSDPFGGTGGESYDPSVSGAGSLGGLGYRATATPVIVAVTDNIMRDPDSGYGTPDGCPLDAGTDDVITEAAASSAWFVGLSVEGSTPLSQMQSLATDLGSLVDKDGDGTAGEPAAWQIRYADVNEAIVKALTLIAEQLRGSGTYSRICLDVAADSHGLITAITPTCYSPVDLSTTDSLDFIVTLTAPAATGSVVATSVELELIGDGETLDSRTIAVEITPE